MSAQDNKKGLLNSMNKVMGLVYFGASFLIIVVGLRGLGKVVKDFLPQVFLDEKGMLNPGIVILAILIEFAMLILLAIATMKQKEEKPKVEFTNSYQSKGLDVNLFRSEIEKIKELTGEEKLLVRNYLEEFENISDKITRIQEKNILALKTMKEELSK